MRIIIKEIETTFFLVLLISMNLIACKVNDKPDESKNEFYKDFARMLLSTFTKQDFEKPFYKSIILMHIAIGANTEGNLQFEKLPKISN